MSRTFTILKNKCYFCNAKETIRFNEHYRFCPECSAIYTNMIIHRKGCKHINTATPVVVNNCWFSKHRDKKPYLTPKIGSGYFDTPTHYCSKCGRGSDVDGW